MINSLKSNRKLITLSPDKIVPSPFQPRREFEYYELLELSASIQRNGIIQPLTVRKSGERYELISGERRLRAAVIAGLKNVPCILVAASDRESSLMCLIENIQRTDLNFFEEAEGIKRLMDEFCLSRQDVSEKLAIAQSTLSNKLRLLKLEPEQRKRISLSGLSERHARAFIRLPEERRDEIINRVIAEQLKVEETERLVETIVNPPEKAVKSMQKGSVGNIKIFTNSITKMVDTMRRSGIEATTRKNETESHIEYTIRIPKKVNNKGNLQLSLFDASV